MGQNTTSCSCFKFLRVLATCLELPFCLSCFGYAQQGAVSSKHVNLESHLDIDGGGMVDVQGNIAVVDHMGPPYATSLIDAIDQAKPRIIARIQARPGTHYHKARICDKNLVLNVESYGGGGGGKTDLALYDIANPNEPKEGVFYTMGGMSTGRGYRCPPFSA
jgi:hypothetical protein